MAGAPDRGVAHPGRQLGGGDPVRIRLLVDEAERVDRLEPWVALLERALVEEVVEPGRRRQPEVVTAVRADPEGLVELLVEQLLLARRALRPEVRRVDVAAGAERRQLDRHQANLIRSDPRGVRFSRQATSAAPAIDRAAEASVPPMSSGRRDPGQLLGTGRIDEIERVDRAERRGGQVDLHDRHRRDGRRVLGTGGAGQATSAAATSARRPASRSSNRNDGWTRMVAAASQAAAERTAGSSSATLGVSLARRSRAASSDSR